MVKNLPANAGDVGDRGLIPESERSPRRGNAVYCSILSWEIPWTDETGGLQSVGLQKSDITK